jgi:hypothetical protein
MDLFPVINTPNGESSQTRNWYYSEFQQGQTFFSMEFSISGAGEFCDYFWVNYPEQNSITISCNKDIYLRNDTLKSGSNLIDYFEVQKFEKNFFITFLISERLERRMIFTEQFYTFSASVNTSLNEYFTDSCIIKK